MTATGRPETSDERRASGFRRRCDDLAHRRAIAKTAKATKAALDAAAAAEAAREAAVERWIIAAMKRGAANAAEDRPADEGVAGFLRGIRALYHPADRPAAAPAADQGVLP